MQYKFHSFSLILTLNAFILKIFCSYGDIAIFLKNETINGAFVA